MSQSITSKDSKAVFAEAKDYEASKSALIKQSERRAWMSFRFSMGFNLLLVVGLVVLITKQTLFPYLVTVDKNTGHTEIVSVLDEEKLSAQTAMDKYWLSNYVRWHESYNFMTIQSDYDATQLFSSDEVAGQYRALYEGEYALDETWGKKVEAVVRILTIIPEGDDIARVRFAKTIRPTGSTKDGQTTVWVATIGYEYDMDLKLSKAERRKNPLGFQVTAYRIDPELGG